MEILIILLIIGQICGLMPWQQKQPKEEKIKLPRPANSYKNCVRIDFANKKRKKYYDI